MKIKNIVALELDESLTKFLVLSPAGSGSTVLAAGAVKIPIQSNEEAGIKLKEVLERLKVTSRLALVTISRLHATSRILKLPSTDPQEIRRILGFQSVKLVPFSKDEIIIDYTVLETSQEGYSKVHVVLVPKNIVSDALSICAEAGLDILSLRLNTQESVSFYEHAWRKRKGGTDSALIIEDDLTAVHFLVKKGNHLLFSRSINFSVSQNSLTNPQNMEKFSKEIGNTLNLYKKEEPDQPLTKIILTNTLSKIDLKSLKEKLGEKAYLIENEPLPPFFSHLPPAKTLFEVPLDQLSFTSLLGAARNIKGASLNFVPESVDKEFKKILSQKLLLKGSILLTGLILCLTGFFYLKNIEMERVLSQLSRQTVRTKSTVEALLKKERKVLLVKKQKEALNFSLDILAENYKLIPKEVSLDSFSYDADKGVFLKGTAFTLSDVVKLVPQFEQSPFFDKVSSKGTTTKKIKNKVYTDFQIELPFAALPEKGDTNER